MEKTQHIVILAAGDFPTHPVPLRALREADLVVCCDSAYNQWSLFSGQCSVNVPSVVIGDGDSLSEKVKRELGDRWIHVPEQDYNDLHKAMQWVMSGQWSVVSGLWSDASTTAPAPLVTILGATGRREDHTLGNISYLVTFAEEHPGIDIEMLTNHGRLTAFRGRRTFNSFPRQQVSIFAADPTLPFSGSGLQYPVDNMRAARWWQATLNSALGDTFTLQSDGWLIVFQTYEPK